MRTYVGSTSQYRPNLDPLEARHLLSGVIQVVGVYSPPALVVKLDTPRPFLPISASRYLAETAAFSQASGHSPSFGSTQDLGFSQGPVLALWSMVRPHREPDLWEHAFGPSTGSSSASDSQLIFSSSTSTSMPGPRDASPAWLASISNTAFMPMPLLRGGGLGPLSMTIQGPPWMFSYLRGEVERFYRADEEFLFAHEAPVRPPSDAVPVMASESNTEHTQGITVVTGVGYSVQVSVPLVINAVHLTALLDPESVRNEMPSLYRLINEPPGSRISEPDAGFLSQWFMVNSPASETLTAVTTVSHPDFSVISSEDDLLATDHQGELPLPQSAGLIADILPFDRASLEEAVDQLFEHLEDLGVGQLVEQGPTRVLPLSLALLGTVTAVEVARRRLRSSPGCGQSVRRRDALGSEELLGFPELPGSWSTRLT
jgi:hypothetical protein